MKYRKKPVVIEGFQWTGGPDQVEDPPWACEAMQAGRMRFENAGTPNVVILIDTLEGTMRCSRGDYIIQGVKGEIYPCKSDIFEMTYEAVREEIDVAALLKTLVREVMAWHADKDSTDYNLCDTEPCDWCERAAKELGEKP